MIKMLYMPELQKKIFCAVIVYSIMFLEQSRSHFLPGSRQPAIKLARKDTATVFQRHHALYDILQITN